MKTTNKTTKKNTSPFIRFIQEPNCVDNLYAVARYIVGKKLRASASKGADDLLKDFYDYCNGKTVVSDAQDMVQEVACAVLESALYLEQVGGQFDWNANIFMDGKETTPLKYAFCVVDRWLYRANKSKTASKAWYDLCDLEEATTYKVLPSWYKPAELTANLSDGNELDRTNALIEALDLSKRQEQVLRLAMSGRSNRDIANALGLKSHTTVLEHKAKIRVKALENPEFRAYIETLSDKRRQAIGF